MIQDTSSLVVTARESELLGLLMSVTLAAGSGVGLLLGFVVADLGHLGLDLQGLQRPLRHNRCGRCAGSEVVNVDSSLVPSSCPVTHAAPSLLEDISVTTSLVRLPSLRRRSAASSSNARRATDFSTGRQVRHPVTGRGGESPAGS